MAIEATIVEQLQELRRWQLQQQEELIRQQQEQREMLSNEQNLMFHALSLSVSDMSISEQSLQELMKVHEKEQKEKNLIDFDIPDEECTSPVSQRDQSFSPYLALTNENNNDKHLNLNKQKVQLDVRNNKTDLKPNEDCNNSYNHYNYSCELSIDDMQSITSNKSHRSISIDETPVPSPRKDFNTLLEERLKDSEAVNTVNKKKPVVKRPFLKKGEGLARFLPHSNHDKVPKRTIRPKSASFSNGTLSNGKSKLKSLERCNSLPKSKKNDVSRKSTPNLAPVAQTKLTLKNVAPPRKKPPPRTKSVNSPSNLVALEKKKSTDIVSDTNSSDLEIKSKRELEEVRIFELLEDKAENSSFCSTSSTVIAFLQQSTPLKQKALLHSAAKNKLLLTDIGNQTLEGIVRSSKSNKLPSQPKKNFKESKLSQWDEVPVSKLKNDKTVSGTVLPYGTDIDEQYHTSNQIQNQVEQNESLHVRFSEYNEYKTMTDTSSVSSDSQTIVNYMNDKGAWSDGSVSDSSEVESVISSQLKTNDKNNSSMIETLQFFKKDQDDSEEDETEKFKNEEEYDNENEEENDEEENDEDEIEAKNVTLQQNDTQIDQKNESGSIFKSELLKTRLLELEQEIEIFRKESAALTLQRQKLQEERTKLQEEKLSMQRFFKEKEEALEMEKRKTENILQEEKKRLAREKTALESRMKDAYDKAQKSKQERQEIQTLREQLEELRDLLSQKESKWSATNARQRSQMRVLQTENSKLKQEIEKLQQKKNPRVKKPVPSNTRAIHQINKFLADRKKVSPFKNDDDDALQEELKIPDSAETNYNVDSEEITEDKPEEKVEKVKILKSTESIARTRNLYESLLREATDCFREIPGERRNLMSQQIKPRDQTEEDYVDDEENNYDEELNNRNQPDSRSPKSFSTAQEESEKYHNDSKVTIENQKSNSNKQGIREVHHSDGRVEYWYPNGNVKKVFPDRCLTKMIYYNGDVRETDKNGTVKYFYAATRTWHTTMPDGLEILEFPDGQVERRSKDGTVEVAFPDGSVKIVQADGSEKWALRDGTVAETTADGEKVLTLPNGQREIHTKDHKRREYPDGTVKLVYPDGIQETRYANGRIRLKDKDGNLIMDSHQ